MRELDIYASGTRRDFPKYLNFIGEAYDIGIKTYLGNLKKKSFLAFYRKRFTILIWEQQETERTRENNALHIAFKDKHKLANSCQGANFIFLNQNTIIAQITRRNGKTVCFFVTFLLFPVKLFG